MTPNRKVWAVEQTAPSGQGAVQTTPSSLIAKVGDICALKGHPIQEPKAPALGSRKQHGILALKGRNIE